MQYNDIIWSQWCLLVTFSFFSYSVYILRDAGISMSIHCKHCQCWLCMYANKYFFFFLFTKIWCISRFTCSVNTIYLFFAYYLPQFYKASYFTASSRQQPAVSLINPQEHPAILFINTVCVKRLDVKLGGRLLNIHPLFFFF